MNCLSESNDEEHADQEDDDGVDHSWISPFLVPKKNTSCPLEFCSIKILVIMMIPAFLNAINIRSPESFHLGGQIELCLLVKGQRRSCSCSGQKTSRRGQIDVPAQPNLT